MRAKKKGLCSKCGKIFRFCKLSTYKPTGELRCYNCIRKYGQNKYYVPIIKGINDKSRFLRYDLTEDEKKSLWIELVKRGISPEEASYRVKNRTRYIYWFQKHKYFEKIKMEREKLERNKQFLEGLKNG
jgi:hypothetical protein